MTLPSIVIESHWEAPQRRLPHIFGPGGSICYYASGAIILDRYNPAGTVIQCLQKAEKVVQNALAGRLDDDFADEFAAYWRQRWMMFDLPSHYAGPAVFRYPKLHGNDLPTPVLTLGKSWTTEREPGRHSGEAPEQALVVSVDRPLTVDPNGVWPPTNLLELTRWLEWVDPQLPQRLDEALAQGSHVASSLVIRAPNGVYSARVDIPARYQTVEFLRNRRAKLPRVLHQIGDQVHIERARGDAVDLEYIYGRNIGSRKNLTGKSVLLIGCGTIGGFLAQQLAQCGAGIGGGTLTIADPDELRTANLGRHLLGVPHLHLNKAKACADFLNLMLPGAHIEGIDTPALDIPNLDRFDLIIDATGEEALSLALNHRAVRRRPAAPAHIFVWLVGNGAAAQCIFVDNDSAKSCLKCLKPDLAGSPRFRIERPGVEMERGSVAACGDAEFVTFPVSRSVAAAALACDLALDWVNKRVADRFRSHTFDTTLAFEVKNSSPNVHAQCPECQAHH